MIRLFKYSFIFLSLISITGFAQDSTYKRQFDSLQKIINSAKHDSIIVNAWLEWDNIIYFESPEEGLEANRKMDSLCTKNLTKKITKKEIYFYKKNKAYALNSMALHYTNTGEIAKALELLAESRKYYEDIGYDSGISSVLINIGRVCQEKSDLDDALYYFNEALKIKRKLKDKNGIAIVTLNIGNIYYNQGNFVKAISFSTSSLQQFESLNDDLGCSHSLNNIGLIYHEQKEYDKAIDFYTRSLDLRKKLKDKAGMGGSYNNLGLIYHEQKKYTKALDYYTKSMELCIEAQDLRGYATAMSNIGLINQEQKKYEDSFPYFEKSLEIRKEIEDYMGISQSLHNIAFNLFSLNQPQKALPFAIESFEIAKSHKLAVERRNGAFLLKEIYSLLGRDKDAMKMFEIYILERDSIDSYENQKEIIRQEYKYQYEKEAVADSLKSAEEKKVQDAEIARQKAEIKAKTNQQILLFGGLGLVIVFSIFMYNRVRVTNRQKRIIEEQKQIVDEKNKEITDSINYAKRIQEAILPSKKSLQETLVNGFVFYKPKAIVAGDFYWMEKYDGCVYLAAADCTGHGVPGAMVSVICSNALSKALLEEGITETGKLLDRTRELVIEKFSKSEENVRDGMDISLLKIVNKQAESIQVEWSGANNPIWIIRGGELMEIKGNKQPIGKYEDLKLFTTHAIELKKNDSVYLFTDGFQDQFGGENGKKFKAAKFKELLVSLQHNSMDDQKTFLDKYFENWRGELEQNDDVCVIGLKI